MSRVAIYNLYWHTYGGGEQVSGALAEHLAAHHEVTLLGPVEIDPDASRSRLGVDLSGCAFRMVSGDDEASTVSADYDVFVNGTYRSRAINRAARGFYYVHFPEPPPTPRDRVRHAVATTGSALLGPLKKGPGPLLGVKEGLARRRRDVSWARSYTGFWSNSAYTAGWTERLWDVESAIVFPPVRPVVAAEWSAKKASIASVGRFFDPSLGHCKKQRDLLHAFATMHAAGRSAVGDEQWHLSFVGGADGASRDYTLGVRRAALGLPVEVFVNAPRQRVVDVLGRASIYWHGTGFGEDVDRHPERFEHFGIAVVEAMAAGAVPVVFGAAGPAEIVRHGVDGFHWRTLDELAEHSYRLMSDESLRQTMAQAAVRRAADFSLANFHAAVDAALG
jgi:glycosyltransferase involved in cell wall biosynthesis